MVSKEQPKYWVSQRSGLTISHTLLDVLWTRGKNKSGNIFLEKLKLKTKQLVHPGRDRSSQDCFDSKLKPSLNNQARWWKSFSGVTLTPLLKFPEILVRRLFFRLIRFFMFNLDEHLESISIETLNERQKRYDGQRQSTFFSKFIERFKGISFLMIIQVKYENSSCDLWWLTV